MNVANDLHPQDLMNHGKQGSKRSINCLDTGTSGSERERSHNKEATPDTSVYKSDQSTGEHIVADTEEGVVEKVVGKAEEEQQLTTAMSHEHRQGAEGGVLESPFQGVEGEKRKEGEGEGEREVGRRNHPSPEQSAVSRGESELSEASRSTYSKSSTFPRSKTEGLARDSVEAVAAAGGIAASLPCPPHGAKSVMGRRAKMEDTFVAIPDLIGVAFADSLNEIIPPRIADQMHQVTEKESGPAKGPGGSGGSSSLPPGQGLGTAPLGGDGHDRPKADSDTIVHATSNKISDLKRRDELEMLAAHVAVADGQTGVDARGPAPRSGRPKKLFEQIHFFGVFDGHGGADAAHHCQVTMHERLKEAILASCPKDAMARVQSAAAASKTNAQTLGASDAMDALGALGDDAFSELEASICSSQTFSKALARAFKVTDEEFAKLSGAEEELALVGTTAVVTLLSSQSMYVANAGDSRAVLLRSGVAMALTDDHKAAREDETARVEAAGGQILFWNGVRVMGLLAVSRAIGDHSLRPYVIADPEVTVVNRHPGDELMVMASDGLWDVITNQEACSLAKKCLLRARQKGSTRENAAKVAATVLTRAAVDRGSRDNVTVLVIDLMQDGDDLDQDALKMCMSEDLRAARRSDVDRDDGRDDDSDAAGDRGDDAAPGPVGDGRSLDADADIGAPEVASSSGPYAACPGVPLMPVGPPPTPFMSTPFGDDADDGIGDGISDGIGSIPRDDDGNIHINLRTSASYKSPFETLDIVWSGPADDWLGGHGGSPSH